MMHGQKNIKSNPDVGLCTQRPKIWT